MKNPSDNRAMETPMSMTLLVLSALVVSTALVSLPRGSTDDGQLDDIRSIQARSVAFAVAYHTDEWGSTIMEDIISLPLHVFADGNGGITFTGDPGDARAALMEVLSSTPDGLAVSVLFAAGDDLPPLEGDRISYRAVIGIDAVLTVTLPLHRGCMRSLE